MARLEVGVHEAKSRLSELLRAVASGTEVAILRRGKPVALLVGVRTAPPRRLGADEGAWVVPGDFDEPLPDDVEADFYR